MQKNPISQICDGCGEKLLTIECKKCGLDLCITCEEHWCITGRRKFTKPIEKGLLEFKAIELLSN